MSLNTEEPHLMTLSPALLDGPGCGTITHTSDCLCDVQLQGPPCETSVHPTESLYASIVSNVLPNRDWHAATDDQRLRFLEALTHATDMLAEFSPEQYETLDDVGVVDMELVRDRVCNYLQNGGSIATIEDDLDMDWAFVKLGLAGHKAHGIAWRMTRQQLVEFERLIDVEPKLGSHALRNAFPSLGGAHTSYRRLAICFRGPDHFKSNRVAHIEAHRAAAR